MSNAVERRDTRDWRDAAFGVVQLRAKGERPRIGGYAAKFNTESKNLGGFVETIAPGFFNDSMSRGWPDVIARYNHDDNMLLGTTAARTLDLQVDNIGLAYDVEPPKSAGYVIELVERGDVFKSSFAFYTLEEEWSTSDQGFPKRSLVSGQLVDVAPVVRPAYDDTSSGIRSLDRVEAGLRSLAKHAQADFEEVRKLAEADELRRFFVRTDQAGQPVVKKTTLGAAARMALLAREGNDS